MTNPDPAKSGRICNRREWEREFNEKSIGRENGAVQWVARQQLNEYLILEDATCVG